MIGRQVLVIDHNQMEAVVAQIVVRKIVCAVVIPKWQAKSWWRTVVEFGRVIERVPSSAIVFRGVRGSVPAWEFSLVAFN